MGRRFSKVNILLASAEVGFIRSPSASVALNEWHAKQSSLLCYTASNESLVVILLDMLTWQETTRLYATAITEHA